jgi:hypothetical protein
VEVDYFWNGVRVGGSMMSPAVIAMGAVALVDIPGTICDEHEVATAFRARTADGRELLLDVIQMKPSADRPGATRLVGFLKSK